MEINILQCSLPLGDDETIEFRLAMTCKGLPTIKDYLYATSIT